MDKPHPVIGVAGREFADGKLDRREFLRIATLLGIAAPTAYGMAGLPLPALAQGTPKKGGVIRIGMRVQDISSPHTYSWIEVIEQCAPGRRISDANGHRQRHPAEPGREMGGEPRSQDLDAASAHAT